MRHVGDMHPKLPTARWRAFNGNGVVKVARIHRIDRQQETVADIAAQRILQRRFDIELQ